MIDVNKLKGRMKEKGFTQKTLSNELKVDISTLNRKINNKQGRYLTIEETQGIIDALQIENPAEYFFCNRSCIYATFKNEK